MIRAVVDLELARHQWAEGRRAVDRRRADAGAHRRLVAQVEVVTAELTRRVGQVFTLEELATAYDHADRWTLETIDEAFPDEAPADVSTSADAAFDLYSRRASDYAP
jgi:hypothetical protein